MSRKKLSFLDKYLKHMEGSKTYKVSTGDNLYEISRKYGTTVEQLKAMNGLTSNTIYVGHELIVP